MEKSGTLVITLTVIEILLFVGALAVYLIWIARLLRSIASTLAKITFGVRAVDQQCANIAPAVTNINSGLQDIVGVLPGLAGKAEALAGAGRR